MDQSLENKTGFEGIIPENTLKTFVPQVVVERKIGVAPSRYRNEIAKYIIYRDEEKCTLCGTCVKTCKRGVHVLKDGYKLFATPLSYKCNGEVCEKSASFCVTKCPQAALRLTRQCSTPLKTATRRRTRSGRSNWRLSRPARSRRCCHRLPDGDGSTPR